MCASSIGFHFVAACERDHGSQSFPADGSSQEETQRKRVLAADSKTEGVCRLQVDQSRRLPLPLPPSGR